MPTTINRFMESWQGVMKNPRGNLGGFSDSWTEGHAGGRESTTPCYLNQASIRWFSLQYDIYCNIIASNSLELWLSFLSAFLKSQEDVVKSPGRTLSGWKLCVLWWVIEWRYIFFFFLSSSNQLAPLFFRDGIYDLYAMIIASLRLNVMTFLGINKRFQDFDFEKYHVKCVFLMKKE